MVNFLIYLFIAIAHKGKKKKKKINPMSLSVLIKHILILSAYAYSTRCYNLVLPPVMEADTVYEHFSGDIWKKYLWTYGRKKYLWTKFIIKEQKLVTSSNKEISFYWLGFTHRRPGQFKCRSVTGKGLQNYSLIFCWWTNTVIPLKFRSFFSSI